MKTRRAFLVEPGRFELDEVEITPGPEDVLVKVTVCGLCNWELNHWKGLLGKCPQSLGHEWGGTVVEVGRDVVDVKPGDFITGLPDSLNGFSEYALMGKRRIKVNPGINSEHIMGEPLKCVTTVLRGAAPEAGDVGVVVGCGPMGLWCIQGLAGNLLSALIAIDIDDDKLALAQRYGATHTLNPDRSDPVTEIREITDGEMADFVIEGTGNPGVLDKAPDYLKARRGRLIIMSSYEGRAAFDLRKAIAKGIEVRATHPPYAIDEYDDLRRAVKLLNRGIFKMESILTHRFTLDNIQKAFETLENKPAGYLKGIIVPE